MLEQECADLEEENKKLKSDLAFERTMLDNVRAEYESLQDVKEKLNEEYRKEIDNKKLSTIAEETISDLQARIKELKERIDVLYEFIERNDKLVDEVIDEEDLDKLNRYIYIDDDLVDRTLESED
jgi:gas vesicle protein